VVSLPRHAIARNSGRLLNLEIHRRCFPAVLFDLILDLLPFIERAQSSALDRGDVDEHVFAASLRLDKSIALGWIEPLHGAARHFDLPGHTIRGDVILVGDLVAKATTELYTAVFRCLTRAVASCRCPGACASGIRCLLDQLDVVLWLVDLVEIGRARIRSAGKGHINGRVTVTLVKCAG
jgi:hypothetical protein